jgi:hypothetical protein
MSEEVRAITAHEAFDFSGWWLSRAEKLDQKAPAYEKALQLGGLWMQLGSLIADSGVTPGQK